VVDAFEFHSRLDARSMICAMNADLVIIPGGMTSKLHILMNMACKEHLK
jgi:hypothetical protein